MSAVPHFAPPPPIRRDTCDCWLTDYGHPKFGCHRDPVRVTVAGSVKAGMTEAPVCDPCGQAIVRQRQAAPLR